MTAQPPKVWDQFAIKAEVQRRGMSLTSIAREAGLYENACRMGLIGQSRKGAQAVADALGIPFRELFPTLYPSGRYNEPSRTRPAGTSAKTRNGAVTDRRAS